MSAVRQGPLRLSPSVSLGASAKQGRLSRKAREEAHPQFILVTVKTNPRYTSSLKWPTPPLKAGEPESIGTGEAMSFGLYTIGFAILIGGLVYAARLAHMPTRWIVVGAIVLLGVGIVTGVTATRQKDPPQ